MIQEVCKSACFALNLAVLLYVFLKMIVFHSARKLGDRDKRTGRGRGQGRGMGLGSSRGMGGGRGRRE